MNRDTINRIARVYVAALALVIVPVSFAVLIALYVAASLYGIVASMPAVLREYSQGLRTEFNAIWQRDFTA